MQYCPLGNTGLQVSLLCLGTMTWGEQNTEAEGHAQLDCAVSRGINFIDVAEMYPVPPKAETQGATERILGTWLDKHRGERDKYIIATKVTGKSEAFPYLRDGPRLSRAHIMEAVDGSLKRLQTDYIDLYQLHWPERSTNCFGQLGYEHREEAVVPLEESLSAMDELVQAGKIRHVGISNETPWGVMECLRLAKEKHLPRVVSVQNPYNLLNRTYEIGLAEMSIREQCGLLAYSPLAFGMLTGKYEHGAKPEGARLSMFSRFQRYQNERGKSATRRYVELARKHGISPAKMALAYINSRPFLTSNIIGATTLEQLRENIDSMDITLSPDILSGIEQIHQETPNPCP